MPRGPLVRAAKCEECGKQTFSTWAEAALAAAALSTREELLPLEPYMDHGVWHLTSQPHRNAAEEAARLAKDGAPKTESQRAKRRRHASRWRKTDAGKACQKRYLAKKKRKKHLTRVAWALTALIGKLKEQEKHGNLE